MLSNKAAATKRIPAGGGLLPDFSRISAVAFSYDGKASSFSKTGVLATCRKAFSKAKVNPSFPRCMENTQLYDNFGGGAAKNVYFEIEVRKNRCDPVCSERWGSLYLPSVMHLSRSVSV